MDKLPIDIHSGKLLKWLVSRRHCKQNVDLTEIRKKIGEAIKDMPENERILQLLAGSYIHYFHCKEIVEILKDTEKDSRNIFGSYSSQRMKDWKEILNLYEKDNTYLVEAAQLMQRLIQYEIPAANRQITKGEHLYDESVKKQEEYAKQAVASVVAYKKELSEMGIKGENVKKEIIELTTTIPDYLEKIVETLKELKPAIEYYDAFKDYNQGKNVTTIPFLRKLIDKGLFTYYEFVNNEEPESIEKLELKVEENKGNDDEIDFGDDDGIDFGDDNEANFDIEVLDDNSSDKESDKVARGQFALTVLEQVVSLRQFHFDLDELETFLHFRYIHLTQPNPLEVHFAGIEKKPESITTITPEMIQKWIQKIKEILKKIDKKIKMLIKARREHEYVDELVDHFVKLKLQEQKYHRLSELSIQKQEDSIKMIQVSKKDVEILTNALIYLKEEIEKDISKKYNRECNIIGEIYNVLP